MLTVTTIKQCYAMTFQQLYNNEKTVRFDVSRKKKKKWLHNLVRCITICVWCS